MLPPPPPTHIIQALQIALSNELLEDPRQRKRHKPKYKIRQEAEPEDESEDVFPDEEEEATY